MPAKVYKFTKKRREEFLEGLREGQRRGMAARAVGVDRKTVYRAMKADPEFADAVEDAEMDAHEQVEDALFEAATSGNVRAIEVYLFNRYPERWKDMRALKAEMSGPDNKPVQLEVSDAGSPFDVRRIAQDPELARIASDLFTRLAVGEDDASGTGEVDGGPGVDAGASPDEGQ